MEIRNGFSFRTAIRAWGYVIALGCFSLSAHAQSDWGDKVWWNASGSQWVPDYNKSAAFQGTKATPYTGGGALVVNGAGIVHGPAEWPKGRASAPIPGLSRSAPIDVVARFKPASVAAATGRLIGKIGPIATAVSLVTFAAEIGFILQDEGGQVVVKQPTPGACTNPAGCAGYVWSSSLFGTIGPSTSSTPNCSQFVGRTNTSDGVRTATAASGSIDCNITYTSSKGGCCGGFTPAGRGAYSMPYNPTAVQPSSMSALESAIAAKSGWPSGSQIGPVIKQALESGEVIETEPATVSGPASSPVSVSVVNNPNGSTTTKTTTNNYTYNGPSVKVSTVTVTNTFNPATGTTDTTTETTEETPDTTPAEEEKSQCDLTPDALGCAELDTPTETIPTDTETIDFQEEEVFGSGSCPANLSASIATLGQSVTVWDWSKTCDLALPLRALVLGLASFAALLIVMPGDNKT